MRGIFTFTFLFLYSYVFSQVTVAAYPTTASQRGSGSAFTASVGTLTTGGILSDDIRINTIIPSAGTSQMLILGSFNFSTIPSGATITDIDVLIEGLSTNNRAFVNQIQLTSNGTLIGINGASTNTNTLAEGGNVANNNDVTLTFGVPIMFLDEQEVSFLVLSLLAIVLVYKDNFETITQTTQQLCKLIMLESQLRMKLVKLQYQHQLNLSHLMRKAHFTVRC